MRTKKKFLLHLIISEIERGHSPAQISKAHNISLQKLNYYLRQLKNEGYISKVSYGVWKVIKRTKNFSTKDTPSPSKQIRGHAFIWKIKLPHHFHWKKRLDFLGIPYQTIGIKNTPRIVVNDKKVWLTNAGMVIYEPKSFFGSNSIQSKGKAVYELDKTIKSIFKYLQIDEMKYEFKTSREHFGMMNNELARQYNDKGEKLFIHRKDGSAWMWIDDSYAINELETDEMLMNKKVQDFWNDNKKHNFEVTPSFILEGFNKVQQQFSQMISNPQQPQQIPTLPKTKIDFPSYIN